MRSPVHGLALALGAWLAAAGGALAQTSISSAPPAPASVGDAPTPTDADLDRIPPSTAPSPTDASPSAAPANGAAQSAYLENAVNLSSTRGGLPVPPPATVNDPWEEHLFLDARKTWSLAPTLTFTLSSRFNVQAQNDIPFPERQNVRVDFREDYFSWAPADGTYLDAGRINLKSGVAIGANPTDFFKTRAVVDPLSPDPAVLRNDRLGTLMLRLQQVWSGGAVTFAYAPKVASQSRIYTDQTLPSFNPMFDRTNATNRFMIKGNLNLAPDVSPEALVYYADGRAQVGLNVTASVGKALVPYLEWSGGVRGDLVHDAVAFGQRTGDLPAAAPIPFADGGGQRFRNDVIAGMSYTTPSQIVFNLEYHYFEAGFSGAAWQAWFREGQAGAASTRAELWYIREYAADQQSPVTRQSAFLRFDRTDAFIHNLELQGFVTDDLYDGSGSAQIEADDYLSNQWTVGGLVNSAFGGRRSDFGGSPAQTLVQVKIARYF